jgi:hypothetical protein
MLPIAAQVPDAAGRDQFADRLAHKARITEDVVRAEIRKAAVERRTTVTPRELPSFGQIRQAEKGLIWGLFQEPTAALDALAELEPDDLATLLTRRILEMARRLHESGADDVPSALLARLNMEEARLVTGIAAEPAGAAPVAECVAELKRLRYERESADLQRRIGELQARSGPDAEIAALWQRKIELVRLIERLST